MPGGGGGGCRPPNTQLTPWPDDLKKWETLSAEEKKLFARQAEVFAAYVAYTDHEIGRVIQAVEEMGKLNKLTLTIDRPNLPPFVKVNPKSNVISTMDESRTSPIKHMERLDGKIILRGGEGARAWTVIVLEATGKMSAAVSAEEHGFLIFGACTPL